MDIIQQQVANVRAFCVTNAISYRRSYISSYKDGRRRLKLYRVTDVQHASRLLQAEFGNRVDINITTGVYPPVNSIVLVFKAIP